MVLVPNRILIVCIDTQQQGGSSIIEQGLKIARELVNNSKKGFSFRANFCRSSGPPMNDWCNFLLMVGKNYFFCALLYANLYLFNLAWLLNPRFCISHVFGSLRGMSLDDICSSRPQSFRQTVQSAQFSTWSMRKKFLGKKKFVLCVCCGQVLKEIKWNSWWMHSKLF